MDPNVLFTPLPPIVACNHPSCKKPRAGQPQFEPLVIAGKVQYGDDGLPIIVPVVRRGTCKYANRRRRRN